MENYGLSIGQLKVGEKTNEIKEIPKLLKKLDISKCVITIDAIACQKEIAKQIVEQKGHYCLTVKTNQAILYDEIREYFSYAEKEEPEKLRAYETLEKNHGRIEKRKYKISQDIDYLMKLDKRFDKKKKMTYEKMSMLYTYHLEYVQELIFEKIVENI